MSVLALVSVVIIVALVFDFTNGFHDAANAMSTSVATGALRPKQAVAIAAVLNLVGALLSTEVAKTISSGMVDDKLVSPEMVLAGLVGAILWNLATWLFGMPSSSSHALFGGLIGAVLVSAGVAGVNFGVVVSKILLPALVAPLVAGVAAWAATRLAYWIIRFHRADSGLIFRAAQKVSASMVALAHGTSDGQKTMGVITLVLVAGGFQEPGSHPQWWVILLAATALGIGTYSGGWRIMRTMGRGFAEIEPPQGFTAETSSMVAILASSHFGFGLSTTHVTAGAIMGTGLARTPQEVRWATARRMVAAWLLTLPAAGIVGALAAALAHQGAWGVAVVIVLLLIGMAGLGWLASQNSVSHGNVSEEAVVTVRAGKNGRTPKRSPAGPAEDETIGTGGR